MALFLSPLSPAATWLDRLSEALSAPRIIRPSVSAWKHDTYDLPTPGDSEMRKVGEGGRGRNWVAPGAGRCSVEESGPPLLYVITLLSLT